MMSSSPSSAAAAAPAAAPKKLWGGRFSGSIDPSFEKFNASISFDRRLWSADIKGSQVYAKALAKSGVITNDECTVLVDGLERVGGEWRDDTFVIVAGDEDIHTANERRLGELVGTVAGKLHTGRSRNDQVATDLRLFVMAECVALKRQLVELLGVVVQRATTDIDVLMPGFTHLQPAQPVRWSHFLLSYGWSWHRDLLRLEDLERRVKVLPLGSGALAGNAFGIDRDFLAAQLGFDCITENSMDAVCDRDFVAEFNFWASMTMVHISQWAEDLIIFASKRYVTIADAYSTGSSLMPQKKNPDALELLRGKSGRVIGSLQSMLVLLKGLPRAYNKDLQEDKEGLFDVCDTMCGCLPIAAGVLATLQLNEDAMRKDLYPEMLATDLAEYLVRKGVPFRDTHHMAGAAVKMAEEKRCVLSELTVADLQSLHPAFGDDVADVWHFTASVDSRNAPGGTARSSVLAQIDTMHAEIAKRG